MCCKQSREYVWLTSSFSFFLHKLGCINFERQTIFHSVARKHLSSSSGYSEIGKLDWYLTYEDTRNICTRSNTQANCCLKAVHIANHIDKHKDKGSGWKWDDSTGFNAVNLSSKHRIPSIFEQLILLSFNIFGISTIIFDHFHLHASGFSRVFCWNTVLFREIHDIVEKLKVITAKVVAMIRHVYRKTGNR